MLGKLVVGAAVVVVVGAVAVELVIPPLVEAGIEERVHEEVPDASSVEAEIDSFPFVTGLAVSGEVRHLTVDVHDVTRGRVPFDVVRLDLEDVAIDRGAIFDQQVEVRSIGSGTITADVSAGAVSALAGVPVDLTPGRAAVTVQGRVLEASVRVADGSLRLTAGPVQLTLAIPVDELLACPLTAEVLDGRVRLSCTVTDVPPVLLDAVG